MARGLKSFGREALSMYVDGFRNMTVGRRLWILILLKLFIFFAILKLFFFPDLLSVNYDDDEQRADAVREALTAEPTFQPEQ